MLLYLNAFYFLDGGINRWIRLLACKCAPYNYPAHSFSSLRNDGNGLGLQRAASWHHYLGVMDHKLCVTSCKGLPREPAQVRLPVTGHTQLLLSLFQALDFNIPSLAKSLLCFCSFTGPTTPPKQGASEELTPPQLLPFSTSCVPSQKIQGVICRSLMQDAQCGHLKLDLALAENRLVGSLPGQCQKVTHSGTRGRQQAGKGFSNGLRNKAWL